MLNIMPKIDEFQNLEDKAFSKYIRDRVEIQLLGDDFLESFENCKRIIEQLSDLRYVVLHLPVRYVDVGFLHCCYGHEVQFIKLIVACIKYSIGRNLNIDILFHARMEYNQFEDIKGFDFLNYICTLVEGTNVGFLVENSIHDPCMFNVESDVFRQLCKNYNNPKLAVCLDLCHLQSSEYMLDCDISLPEYIIEKIKNIHFSKTGNRSGYKNKGKTHSVVHSNIEEVQADLVYLEKKGVILNSVNIVTEILEKNDDYENRKGMCEELSFLTELNK